MMTTKRNNEPSLDGVLLDTSDAADYLGRSPGTLAQWRSWRRGPVYVKKANGRVGYRRADLDAYLGKRGATA